MGPCGGRKGFGRSFRWLPTSGQTKESLQEELKWLNERKAYAEQRLKEL
jgi:hypothetical protein